MIVMILFKQEEKVTKRMDGTWCCLLLYACLCCLGLIFMAGPVVKGEAVSEKLMLLYTRHMNQVLPLFSTQMQDEAEPDKTSDNSRQENTKSQEPADEAEECPKDFYDKAHLWIESSMQQTTEHVDFYFGGDHRVEDSPCSGGKLRTTIIIEDNGDASIKPKFNVKIYLPNLENRVGIFFYNLASDVLPGTTPEDEDSDVDLGIRNTISKGSEHWIYLDGGLSYHGELVAFGRLSLIRHTFQLGEWLARFEQKLFYYTDDGFGELSRLDFDLQVSEHLYLRSTLAGIWSRISNGLEWEIGFKCGIDLSIRERGFFLQAQVNGHDLKPIDNYKLNFTFRTQVLKPYLMLDITPQIEFPRELNYEFTPSLRFALEIYFGHYYKRRKI